MAKYIIAIFVFCMCLAGCNAKSSPVISTNLDTKQDTVNSYSWDFGQIKEGSSVTHDFELVNRTAKVLNIKDVTTSCGCTVPQIQKKMLFPQEKTVISVQFNSKGYAGVTSQFVYVHTDDIQDPVIRFIIKADVAKKEG